MDVSGSMSCSFDADGGGCGGGGGLGRGGGSGFGGESKLDVAKRCLLAIARQVRARCLSRLAQRLTPHSQWAAGVKWCRSAKLARRGRHARRLALQPRGAARYFVFFFFSLLFSCCCCSSSRAWPSGCGWVVVGGALPVGSQCKSGPPPSPITWRGRDTVATHRRCCQEARGAPDPDQCDAPRCHHGCHLLGARAAAADARRRAGRGHAQGGQYMRQIRMWSVTMKSNRHLCWPRSSARSPPCGPPAVRGCFAVPHAGYSSRRCVVRRTRS